LRERGHHPARDHASLREGRRHEPAEQALESTADQPLQRRQRHTQAALHETLPDGLESAVELAALHDTAGEGAGEGIAEAVRETA
jgi:hypothetical protein